MPNSGVHAFVGAGTGFFTSLHRARAQEPLHQLIEGVGGGFAGFFGGKFPDVVEPPTSSWHRGPFHSWTTFSLLASSFPTLDQWEQWCRENADHHQNAMNAQDASVLVRLFHFLAEVLWRFLAAVPAGFVAAWISHLAMDAVYPRGLPLVV